MAGVEHDDKGLGKPNAKAPRPAVALDRSASLDDMLVDMAERLQHAILEQRKERRDKIDVAVPKILSLNVREGAELYLNVRFLLLDRRDSENKLVKSVNAFERALNMDISKIPLKEYEALVKQTWKVAKANIDETLESPEAKQLLAPKGPSPK